MAITYHTLLEILRKSEEWLSSRGVKEARLDTELMMAETLGCKRLDLYLKFDDLLREPELGRIREMVRRRGKREPLAYILGHTEFFNLKLKCDSRALIPRQETEQLCDILTEKLKESPPERLLDMGTGTGAIVLGLLNHWKDASGVGVDLSDEALALASENATATKLADRLTLLKGRWFESVTGTYDLIVSNPPYLTYEEWEAAEPEVRDKEPKGALVAEHEGAADLLHLLREAPRFLKGGGWLAMETGIDHEAVLTEAAKANGAYAEYYGMKDYSGRQRFFFAKRS